MTYYISESSNEYSKIIDWFLNFYTDIIDICVNDNLKLEYIEAKLKIYEEEYE